MAWSARAGVSAMYPRHACPDAGKNAHAGQALIVGPRSSFAFLRCRLILPTLRPTRPVAAVPRKWGIPGTGARASPDPGRSSPGGPPAPRRSAPAPRSPSRMPPGAAAPPVSARAPETGARHCISGGRPPGDALRPLTPAPASCCALLSSEVAPASRAREGYMAAPRRSVYQRIVDRAIRSCRLCGAPEPVSLWRTCAPS
jgi:hypothetical protein